MKQVRNIVFIAGLFMTTSIMMGHAQVTIGSLNSSVGGALLDLKERDYTPTDTTSSTRGLVFPRVKLSSLTELYPMYGTSAATETSEYKNARATLKKKHMGLTVYSLTRDTTFNPGLYTWNGESWVKPVTELPDLVQRSINLLDLKPTTGTTDVEVKAVTNTTLDGGSLLPFNGQGYLTIPENGTYYFNLRLYGTHITNPSKYYVSVWKNGSVNGSGADATLTGAELMDKFEADIYYINAYSANSCFASYVVNLCCALKAGDQVRFKIGYEPSLLGPTTPTPWTLKCSPDMVAPRSTMFWWKL